MSKLGVWFSGYTLIDVTNTGVFRPSTDLIVERNQQRNWETVMQTVGLRTQLIDVISPKNPKTVSLAGHEFGSYYRDSQRCWKFMFFVEHPDVFGPVEDPTRFLEQDFNEVPVITGLTETAALPDPVFYTTGILKNLYFKVSF
jgi:hypothetical protein